MRPFALALFAVAVLLAVRAAPSSAFVFPGHSSLFRGGSSLFAPMHRLRRAQQPRLSAADLAAQRQAQHQAELQRRRNRVTSELAELTPRQAATWAEAQRLHDSYLEYMRSHDLYRQQARTRADLVMAQRYGAAARDAFARAKRLADDARRLNARVTQLQQWLAANGGNDENVPAQGDALQAQAEQSVEPVDHTSQRMASSPGFSPASSRLSSPRNDNDGASESARDSIQTTEEQGDSSRTSAPPQTPASAPAGPASQSIRAAPRTQRREALGGTLPDYEIDEVGQPWQAGGVWVGLPMATQKPTEASTLPRDMHEEALDAVETLLRAAQ